MLVWCSRPAALGLAAKPRQIAVLGQELQGNVPVERALIRLAHDPHAAPADLAHDPEFAPALRDRRAKRTVRRSNPSLGRGPASRCSPACAACPARTRRSAAPPSERDEPRGGEPGIGGQPVQGLPAFRTFLEVCLQARAIGGGQLIPEQTLQLFQRGTAISRASPPPRLGIAAKIPRLRFGLVWHHLRRRRRGAAEAVRWLCRSFVRCRVVAVLRGRAFGLCSSTSRPCSPAFPAA